MTKKQTIVGQDGKPSNHGTDATPDRGRRFGTPIQECPMSGEEFGLSLSLRPQERHQRQRHNAQEQRKGEDKMTKLNTPPWSTAHGPADANNNGKVIKPTNTSRSFAKGGAVIGEAFRGSAGQKMHIAGGTHSPGERTFDQHRQDVERGGK